MHNEWDTLPDHLEHALPPNCPTLVTPAWVSEIFDVPEKAVSDAVANGRVPSIEVCGSGGRVVATVMRPRDAVRLWGGVSVEPVPHVESSAPYVAPIPPVAEPRIPARETLASPMDTRDASRVETLVRAMVDPNRPQTVYMAAVAAGYVLPPPGENIGDPVHVEKVREGDVIIDVDGRMGVYIGKGDVLMEAAHGRTVSTQRFSDVVLSNAGNYRSVEVYRLRDL